jgi:hypothetical protein
MLPIMLPQHITIVNPATEALERSLRNCTNQKRSHDSANLFLGLLQVDAVEVDILSCELSKKMEFSSQDSSKKHQPRYSSSKRRCQGLVRTKKSAELKSLEQVPDDEVKLGGNQHNKSWL